MEKLRIALQLRRDHAQQPAFASPSDYVQFQVPKGGFNLWIKTAAKCKHIRIIIKKPRSIMFAFYLVKLVSFTNLLMLTFE